MEISFLKKRVEDLNEYEALNISETTKDGNGIRKVKFNSQTARSLVEVPGYRKIVFNLNRSFEGLDNFLRLEGLDKSQIKKIHQDLDKLKSKSSKKRQRSRMGDDRDFSDGLIYLIVHLYPPSEQYFELFRNKYFTIFYGMANKKYQINIYPPKSNQQGQFYQMGDPYRINNYLTGYVSVSLKKGDIFNFFDINGAFIFGLPMVGEYTFNSPYTSILYNLYSGHTHSLLYPGNTLEPNQYLVSPNGKYAFWNQADGNLVISGPDGYAVGILPYGNPQYSSGGGAPVGTLVFDDGGHLIVYTDFNTGRGTPVWVTKVKDGIDNSNPYLILSNTGVLTSYANGQKLWSAP